MNTGTRKHFVEVVQIQYKRGKIEDISKKFGVLVKSWYNGYIQDDIEIDEITERLKKKIRKIYGSWIDKIAWRVLC